MLDECLGIPDWEVDAVFVASSNFPFLARRVFTQWQCSCSVVVVWKLAFPNVTDITPFTGQTGLFLLEYWPLPSPRASV